MRLPSSTRSAIGLWAVYLAVVCLIPLFQPLKGTIYPTYAVAGQEFAAGRPLYNVPHPHTDNYRYSPLVAAAFVPFTLLPMGVGGLVWRLLSAAVFLTALAAWARRVNANLPLAALFVCALPLAHASLYNGQANALVIGLLLWSAVLAADGRWALAAVPLAAAALLKGYPLAFGLLVALAAPLRFGLPMIATIAAGLALPFALQSPEYVEAQYRFWFDNLSRDDRTNFPLFMSYQDIHMLLRVSGVNVPREQYAVVQAGMGVLAAAVVVRQLWKGIDRRGVVLNAFVLGVCWMVLFGPSTESSTFILLAPVMGRELTDRAGRPRWARVCAFAGAGLFTLSVLIYAFPHHIHRPVVATGIQPLAALLLSAAAVGRVCSPVAPTRGNRIASPPAHVAMSQAA